MILNSPQALVITIIATLLFIVIPATLYWFNVVFHQIPNSLLIRKKYFRLSLFASIFCIVWLLYQPVPLTVWIVNKSLHFHSNAFSVYLLYYHFIDCFFHHCVLWCLVAKYWMLFFHSHWTSVSLHYIWIHIRGPTSRNPPDFVDISHSFWIKYQSFFGRFITSRVIHGLCFLFLLFLFLCQLSLHDVLSLRTYHALCFTSGLIPYICITLLWCTMPSHYADNIGFKTQMRITGVILGLLFIFRASIFVYGVFCGLHTDIYYALSASNALCLIFGVMCSQMHIIQTHGQKQKERFFRASHMHADQMYTSDILRRCFKSKKLTQIFIHHLAKEMCLEYLVAFVELTQFRHLAERRLYLVHEALPHSHYADHYKRIHFKPFIPRSSVVHNKKYSQYLNKKKRIAKIASKLVTKYFTPYSVLEIFVDPELKQTVVECCEYEKWDALLVQLEICRAHVHQILTESVQRLCQYQRLNRVTDASCHNGYVMDDTEVYLDTQDIKIGAIEELISNDWVTAIDTAHMGFQTEIIYDEFMRSFPSRFRVMNVLKVNKNYEGNVMVYQSILETLENKTERILFHGTCIDNVKRIVCNGFNPDYNTRSAYGKGTYFATKADRACQYCIKDEDSDCFAMFICRVIVGDYTTGQRPMEGQRDNIPYQHDAITQYDSLVDDLLSPSVFVINRDYRAIPEYIVVFKE